ncbi:6-bladed beta-propeller [Rhodohalobacter sp. SW132]|nr:6-bladed beta-propeller [Rhodohalobacter sp. SW132]
MLIVALAAFAFACNKESRQATVPDHLDEIENLTIFSGADSPNAEINFEREISIGDSPEQPIGRMGGFAVDDLGRIYMSDVQQNTLHIFEPGGEYFTSVGRSGEGPGEYAAGPFPVIKMDQLFLLDIRLSRVTQYSIADLELVRTINVYPTNKGSFDGIFDTHIHQIQILGEETFLVILLNHIPTIPEDAGELKEDKQYYFYLMRDDARLTRPLIDPVPLYEITGKSSPEQSRFTGQYTRAAPSPQIFTKPIFGASDDGSIYFAMSDHILIRKYSTDGDYQSAIYQPFENLEMSREDAISSQVTPYLADLVSQNEIPETWPAMDRMLVDDEGRIWIATIVENFDVYEWWILEESGELITTFQGPRDEPIEVVRDGKIYTRETDEETGLVQVVRYRVEME